MMDKHLLWMEHKAPLEMSDSHLAFQRQFCERLLDIRAQVIDLLSNLRARWLLNMNDPNYLAAMSSQASTLTSSILQFYQWFTGGSVSIDSNVEFSYPIMTLRNLYTVNGAAVNEVEPTYDNICYLVAGFGLNGIVQPRTSGYVCKFLYSASNPAMDALGLQFTTDPMGSADISVPLNTYAFAKAVQNHVGKLISASSESSTSSIARNFIVEDQNTFKVVNTFFLSTDEYAGDYFKLPGRYYRMGSSSSTFLETNTLEVMAPVILEFLMDASRVVAPMTCFLNTIQSSQQFRKDFVSKATDSMSDKQLQTLSENLVRLNVVGEPFTALSSNMDTFQRVNNMQIPR